MTFATRSDLTAAIAAWLNRTDLSARIPDFIRLAEARLNRLLRDPDQIASGTIEMANGVGDLPADFGQMVAFGAAGSRLSQVTPAEFGTYRPQAGSPRVYTVSGGTVQTLPASGSVSTPITYYRAIPALAVDNDSNWLLERAPDLYLHGSLLQAEFFGWNDDRLPLIKSAWDEGIAELRADGETRRWGAAPLGPKLGRT